MKIVSRRELIEQTRALIEPPVLFEETNLNAMQQAGFRAGYKLASEDAMPLDLAQSTVFAIADMLASESDDGNDYWIGRIVGRLRYAEELLAAIGGQP